MMNNSIFKIGATKPELAVGVGEIMKANATGLAPTTQSLTKVTFESLQSKKHI